MASLSCLRQLHPYFARLEERFCSRTGRCQNTAAESAREVSALVPTDSNHFPIQARFVQTGGVDQLVQSVRNWLRIAAAGSLSA